MKVVIEIENVGGIWFVNKKRLGHDLLTPTEINALQDFIQEFKQKAQ